LPGLQLPGAPSPRRTRSARFREGEVLSLAIFGELALHDLVEVDNGDRHLTPRQERARRQPTLARDQHVAGRDDDRVQQPDLGDAGRRPFDVAEIAPVTDADGEGGNALRRGLVF
jgi:hypothetical protein